MSDAPSGDPSTPFGTRSLEAFLDELASSAPTPGGGTGAAVVGATGAALVEMLARLTIGRKKYAAHDALMTAIAEQAAEERATLLRLADEDAASYEDVGKAMRLPKATPEEQSVRKEAMQEALRGACEVPFRVMEHCVEVISLAKNAVRRGNTNAASDGAAGAEFARSAMKVAAYNVKINLVAIEDATFVAQAHTRIDEMLWMGTAAAQEIDSHVAELWAPKKPSPQ